MAPMVPARPYRVANWMRLGLALAWISAAICVLALGERTGTLKQVSTAVSAGRVKQVQITGENLPGLDTGPGSGSITQEVHWRTRFVRRVAEVTVSYGQNGSSTDHESSTAETTYSAGTSPTPNLKTDAGIYLRARNSRLLITRGPEITSFTSIFNWRVPGWLGAWVVMTQLAVLGLLIGGPQPWRATRWAWFWLWWTPIGALAFILFSGPTPFLPVPRDVERRLTGGWALLLTAVIHR